MKRELGYEISILTSELLASDLRGDRRIVIYPNAVGAKLEIDGQYWKILEVNGDPGSEDQRILIKCVGDAD